MSCRNTTTQRALQWIQECDVEHGESKCLVAAPELPSRVLDVNSTGTDEVSLYTSHGEHERYAALSYVDDTHSPYNTLSRTIEAHNGGFTVDTLPQTFQDAITMTRKVGLQYLWIDALW
jgi:hypothetical protein